MGILGHTIYVPVYTFNGGIMDYVVWIGIGMALYVAITAYEYLKEKRAL